MAAGQISEALGVLEVPRQLAKVKARLGGAAAAELWGITEGELQEIRQSLAELG